MIAAITVSLLNQDDSPVAGKVVLFDNDAVRLESDTVEGIASFAVDSTKTYHAYVLSTEATFQRYEIETPADGANYDMLGATSLRESSAAAGKCRVYGYATSLHGVPDESFVFRAQAISGPIHSENTIFTRNTATAVVSGVDGFFYLDLPYDRAYLATSSLGCAEGFTKSRQISVPAVSSRRLDQLLFPYALSAALPQTIQASEEEQSIPLSISLSDGRIVTDGASTYVSLSLEGDIDATLEASQIVIKRASVQSVLRLTARRPEYTPGGGYDWDTDYIGDGGLLGEVTAQ